MRKGRPAVVLEWAKHRISVDLIARTGQKSASIVTGEVITQGSYCTPIIGDGSAGSAGFQDIIPKLRYRSSLVEDSATVTSGSRVAAEGGVAHYQRLTITIPEIRDAAALAGGVAADRTVGYGRRSSTENAAAVRTDPIIIADGAVEQSQLLPIVGVDAAAG